MRLPSRPFGERIPARLLIKMNEIAHTVGSACSQDCRYVGKSEYANGNVRLRRRCDAEKKPTIADAGKQADRDNDSHVDDNYRRLN